MASDLSAIASLPQRERQAAYSALLPALYASPLPGLVDLIGHLVQDQSVSLVAGRQVLTELVEGIREGKLGAAGGDEREVRKDVLERAVAAVGGQAGNYDEQVSLLKLQLADLLENEEDWEGAAKVLMSVPLDSNNVKMTDTEKLKHLIHIVRLLIEVGDDGQAQSYFNRASGLIHNCDDAESRLAYKLCNARLLDFGRKFNEAALRYFELSWNTELADEDRLQTLSAAVVCCILAPAGPARLRLLSSLYRDDRSPSLGNYTVLSKMYLENVIRPTEVVEFAAQLQAHQVARLPSLKGLVVLDESDDEGEGGGMAVDGGEKKSERIGPETVLDRAVMEHNLLSCSKLYVNISFAGLGALLDLAPAGAEFLARRMIEQERLRGWIDQIEKLIWFENRDTTETEGQTTAGGLGEVEKRPLDYQGLSLTERWDANIGRTAEKVEIIANLIKQRNLLARVDEPPTSAMQA